MNGKDQYSLDLWTRKMMLGLFRVFFRHMPVKYHTFAYATKKFASLDKACGGDAKDIVNFLFTTCGAAILRYGQGLTTTTASAPSPSRCIARSSTRCRGTPSFTDRRSPPSTGFRRRRTTSAPWNSRQSTCGAHRHRDGREVLRQVVRFQEGHTEGDAQEAV